MIFIIVVLTIITICSVFLAYRFVKRALQFDTLVQIMMDDIAQNKIYFDEILNTPTLTNVPEIISLRDNMKIMYDRFCDYIEAFERIGSQKKIAKD